MMIVNLYIRAGTKVAKQHSKLCQKKRRNIQTFACVFINVALPLTGYRISPKLDYCFIMSASLVPLTDSAWI